ncbi:MAG: hypothetical protein RR034_05785, partial [Bacteroidales bacterium]
ERFRGKDYQGEPSFNVKPVEIIYLNDSYERLCRAANLVIGINDISPNIAYLIQEAVEKSQGKIPLTVKIVESNGVFFTEFINLTLKIDPEKFIKNLKLLIDYKLELK